MVAPLNVTSKTTLTELRDFADNIGSKSRIRGKEIAPGKFILYESGKKANIFSKLTGRDEAKTETARKAVAFIMQNADHSGGTKAMGNVRDNVVARQSTLRHDELDKVVTLGSKLETAARTKFRTDVKNAGPQLNAPKVQVRIDDGPKLSELGNTKPMVKSMADDIRAILTSGQKPNEIEDDLKALAGRKGDDLANVVTANLDNDGKADFANSVGKGFRHDLSEALRNNPELGPLFNKNEKQINSFLRDTYNVAAGKLSPNTFDPNDKTTINVGTLKLTEKNPDLGEGAFGTVGHYTSTAKNSLGVDVVTDHAIKFTKDPPTSKNDKALAAREENDANFLNEAKIHMMASETNHPNILKAHGIVKAENGQVGLALEFARLQNVEDAVGIIENANIPSDAKELIKLSLLQDIFSGILHLQQHEDENGDEEPIIHGDLKPQNIFIGENGTAKLADFGTAKSGEYKYPDNKRPVDTAHWKSPHLLKQEMQIQKNVSDAKAQTDKTIWDLNKDANDSVTAVFGNTAKDTVKKNVRDIITAPQVDIQNADLSQIDRTVIGSKKIDNWSAGVIALNLFSGKLFLKDEYVKPGAFQDDQDKDLVAYVSNPFNTALDSVDDNGTVTKGTFGNTTGDLEVDDLINGLLDPDEDEMLEIDAALNHPVFDRDGVGSTETKKLLEALMTKPQDAAAIRNAVQALRTSLQ